MGCIRPAGRLHILLVPSSFNQGKTGIAANTARVDGAQVTQRERRAKWRLISSLKRRPISQGARFDPGNGGREIPAEGDHHLLARLANQFELRNAQSVSQSGETERKERCYREKYINTTDCHCICSLARSMISPSRASPNPSKHDPGSLTQFF